MLKSHFEYMNFLNCLSLANTLTYQLLNLNEKSPAQHFSKNRLILQLHRVQLSTFKVQKVTIADCQSVRVVTHGLENDGLVR